MIVVLKSGVSEKQLDNLTAWLGKLNVEARLVKGEESTILGLVGDTSNVDIGLLQAMDIGSGFSKPMIRAKCVFILRF